MTIQEKQSSPAREPSITMTQAGVPLALEPRPAAASIAARWTPGQLEIHLLDVKHGDAQLIVSPTGETMLVDCGRKETAPRVARYVREVLGELSVDYVLLSHYHTDHIEGFVPLLRNEKLRVRRAVLDRGGGRHEHFEPAYPIYHDCVTDSHEGLVRRRVRPGDRIDLGPKLDLRVLAVGDVDTRTAAGIEILHENQNSIALWLSFGHLDYCTAGDLSGVSGDLGRDLERAVISLLPREADVWKADHHGIDGNSNAELLAALNPKVVLVSTSREIAGLETIRRLEKQADIYITDEITAHTGRGDITLTSRDGATYTVGGKTYLAKP